MMYRQSRTIGKPPTRSPHFTFFSVNAAVTVIFKFSINFKPEFKFNWKLLVVLWPVTGSSCTPAGPAAAAAAAQRAAMEREHLIRCGFPLV